MLASTLIRRLQKQIEEHGDLPVYVGHPTEQWPIQQPVTFVDRIHKGNKSIDGSMFVAFHQWPDCIRLRSRTE